MTRTKKVMLTEHVLRPKIKDKYHFDLKVQFLKELHDNTFSGLGNEDANEHIKKSLRLLTLLSIYLNKIKIKDASDFSYVTKLTGAASCWLRNEPAAWEWFKELLLRCPQHYLTDMQEVILFYMRLEVPTRQILDSKGAIPSMKAAKAKKAIQEIADHS
ncbi:hypothetical protein Tco_1438217 [Tanacetum coccineum]